jgi:uroporphyrinogen decarboxylase
MNVDKWKKKLISSNERFAIPIITHPGIEIINRTVSETVQNGQVQAMAIKKVAETFPTAAITLMMDLTVEAEAFGCKVVFPENDMPHVLGRLLCNREDVEKLQVPDLITGRVPEYLKAVKLIVDSVKNKPVFAGAIGPFSLAARLYDMTEIMMCCYTEPDVVEVLLNKCTEFIVKYCLELKRIGCDGVLIAEPAAGLLSNEDCQTFSSKYIKHIVNLLQDDTFMIILHNCGNNGHCTDAMLMTDADALHFGNAIDILETLKKSPKDKLIMGNIDPVGVFKMLTYDEVYAITRKLLEETSTFDNFILSSGCDLPSGVPIENITAFFDALEEYNNYKMKI